MRLTPEKGGAGIVLVGNFNPAIFHPEWFRARHLITQDEADQAVIKGVVPDVSAFSLPWAEVLVNRINFAIETGEDPFVRINDLVTKVFLEQLPHTPLSAVAINRAAHFKLADRDAMDRIGFALAPLQPWGDWAPDIMKGGEKHGGVRSITMEQSAPDDRKRGQIRATVQPSELFKPGIWFQINDHYDLDAVPTGSSEIVEILRNQFDRSVARAEWIIDQVLRLA